MVSEEQAKKARIRSRIYQRSPRGRKVKKLWVAKHKDQLTIYNREYMSERSKYAKDNGLCVLCLAPKDKVTVFCPDCRERIRKNTARYRKRKIYKLNQFNQLIGVQKR